MGLSVQVAKLQYQDANFVLIALSVWSVFKDTILIVVTVQLVVGLVLPALMGRVLAVSAVQSDTIANRLILVV